VGLPTVGQGLVAWTQGLHAHHRRLRRQVHSGRWVPARYQTPPPPYPRSTKHSDWCRANSGQSCVYSVVACTVWSWQRVGVGVGVGYVVTNRPMAAVRDAAAATDDAKLAVSRALHCSSTHQLINPRQISSYVVCGADRRVRCWYLTRSCWPWPPRSCR
jgi:hypothetical protein